MGFGRTTPKGSLPVHSVDTEEQAQALIASTCRFSWNREYVAPELVEEQTLENLGKFALRLRQVEQRFIAIGHPAWGKA